MRKVIIGYNGSERSEDAVELGRVVCDVADAQPVVVEVISIYHPLIEALGADEALKARKTDIEDLLGARLGDVAPEVHVIIGEDGARALRSIARDIDASAVVIGSCHRGSLGRIAMGSVGTALVHGAPCAIAVAPEGFAQDPSPSLRVGAAFSGSAESWVALKTAIGIADRCRGRLTIIAAADYPTGMLAAPWSAVGSEVALEASKTQTERGLREASALVPQSVPVETHLRVGSPAKHLLDESSSLDLLVLGSRAHGALGRTFLGSVSNQVLHSAGCAVMILPRGAGADPLGVCAWFEDREKASAT